MTYHSQNKFSKIAPGVVITGLGVLSPNGLGKRAYWDGLKTGRSGIDHITRFDAEDLPCQIAGELTDFNPCDFMKKSTVKRWHSHVHQAVAASKLALEDAEIAKAGYASERIATSMGTSVGSPDEAFAGHYEAYKSGGFKKVSRFASSAFSGHSGTIHVTIENALRGPCLTISSGCTTGLDVLDWGYRQLRLGKADAALVGATESPIFVASMVTACALGILSKRNDAPGEAMRPFDKGRDGIVLSEAACALVLERKDYALARGAQILGEVAGTGSAAEARNPLILEKEGTAMVRAMHSAMQEGGLMPSDIDAIQAHGVSLEMYDQCETNAYKTALGDYAYRIPVSGIKSMTGQSYAAGGLLGVGAALLALSEGIIAPTINLQDPDPACDLDYVPKTSRRNEINTTLVNAISFGGTHSSVALRKVA